MRRIEINACASRGLFYKGASPVFHHRYPIPAEILPSTQYLSALREDYIARAHTEPFIAEGLKHNRDMHINVDARPELVVRPLAVDDAAAIAKLSGQLGYPVTSGEVRVRIEAIAQSTDHVALAGLCNAELVGWIDAAVERHLQAEDAVVIGGVVVAETARGRGVGKRLCEAVEQWARERGFMRVRVRSQIKREDAHRFYLREGYRQVKTSLVFEKYLD